ncbi:MAG: glycosyltransferase [Oscillochloris sp.]|nr:glycosyltransferase [Oscillochloris sp.]
MNKLTQSLIDRTAWVLTVVFALDRLLKLAAIVHFFRRPRPGAPPSWPAITLLCPISRSPNDLRRALRARAELEYPGPLTCLLICDTGDLVSQAVCRELIAANPDWQARLLLTRPDGGVVASKIAKLQVGLEHAAGDLFCFVDDDVTLPANAMQILATYAVQPDVGAAFGLAHYTAWTSLAESLMSGFVNTNALFSYVPISYLVEPFTITGHCFMLRREVFRAVGGLDGMAGRIDDDHELARRLHRHGLRNRQTPLIYAVEIASPPWPTTTIRSGAGSLSRARPWCPFFPDANVARCSSAASARCCRPYWQL